MFVDVPHSTFLYFCFLTVCLSLKFWTCMGSFQFRFNLPREEITTNYCLASKSWQDLLSLSRIGKWYWLYSSWMDPSISGRNISFYYEQLIHYWATRSYCCSVFCWFLLQWILLMCSIVVMKVWHIYAAVLKQITLPSAEEAAFLSSFKPSKFLYQSIFFIPSRKKLQYWAT